MKSLIITYDKFQDHEVVYPFYRLKEEGDVTLMAHQIGKIYGILGTNMLANSVTSDLTDPIFFKEMIGKFDLLVIPGGVKAMEKIRQEKHVIDFISEWHKTGKVIASTCSGAQLLISAKIVKGKKISAYYAMQDDVENAGAIYSRDPVVVDGNIVSSPHYDHMGIWLKTAIDMVKDGQTNTD
jgi:protease I